MDVALESELTTLPPEAHAVRRDDLELARSLIRGPNTLRRDAFLHVERQIASGRRPWTELVRNDWRSVLEALHRPRISDGHAAWLKKINEGIEKAAGGAREELDDNDSPDHRAQVQKHVAEGRVNLEQVISRGRTKYIDDLPAVESKHVEPRQEMFDIEREVVAELWDELLRDPILTSYDEKLAAALEE